MQKLYLCTVVMLLVIITGMNSCKKTNGVDNNQVIEAPYSLFFSDTLGAVYQSNDGKNYNNIFPADGFPCLAICSQYSNILLVKNNLYVSTDNGKTFSHSYDSVTKYTTTDCNNYTVGLNQSMILNIPDWDRVYITSNCPASVNYLGFTFSFSGATSGTWNNFELYDTAAGGVGSVNPGLTAISFTRLTCGTVCCLALQPHTGSPTYLYRNFYKQDTTHIYFWMECTAGAQGAPRNQTGIGLPGEGFFTLGHLNNRLIAIDSKCTYGAWYSDDTGRTWIQYPGIPANTSLLSISSPFEQTCLIGSSAGLYVLNQSTGTFELNKNGLTSGIIVRGITYKENIYKTGTAVKYIYIATNKGIYQSTDGGNNWVLTILGNYTTIY